MRRDPLRPLRLKWDDRRDPGIDRNRLRAPGLGDPGSRGAPRFVGQVFDAGAMPNRVDRVFLVHPVRFDGPELQGSAASPTVDASRAIPVVVVGSRAPEAGDLLVAVAVGGRWVAERRGKPPAGWLDAEAPAKGPV